MRALKLNEISAVDFPAQEGACPLIIKSRVEPLVGKGYDDLVDLFTSSDEGHQHGVKVELDYEGKPMVSLSYAAGPEGESHDHQLIRAPDGTLTVSENVGHKHNLDADALQTTLFNVMISVVGKTAEPVGTTQPEENDVADKNAANPAEDLAKRDATIKKQSDELADLNALVNLPADHRAHYDGLPATSKGAFLHSSTEARETTVTDAASSNPVVYKAADGSEFRKNDDTRLISMAKMMDTQAKELTEKRIELEQTEFTKRAEDDSDLGLLPGDVITKVALLRAVSKIADKERRDAVNEMLGKAAKISKLSLSTHGVSVGNPTEGSSAAVEFSKRVKEFAKDNKVGEAQATELFLDTEEGAGLYALRDQERRDQNRTTGN